ncbi:MAG: class I SAM-dependent methyltransferase [Gammaproteobacteria bacterium]|nr:class I SAM-dependent methyltransferase [Gammaproteobacteria bacterium]MYD77206.1 class I SAM-dependent methyltransferase [Gammaproteobacteria bacterium]MYJ53015.1 class I SAM-dependent methyltransferase [Gammaproteobacteria bacterium]
MNWDLMIDLHKRNPRQGPGSAAQTRLAIDFSGLSSHVGTLKIADIGCGTGASTLVLAESLNAEITAVDLFSEFLDILVAQAGKRGLGDRIGTLPCSMDDLPFEEASLDAMWAEGSIYNMGFQRGIAYFRRFLKPGGVLAVSEMTWFTRERPDEIDAYWTNEYPEIATASEKIGILEEQGFAPVGYFPLPENCWTDHYYAPLQSGFDAFLARHGTAEASSIIDSERIEIALYERYRDYYGYGFYIARRMEGREPARGR